MSRLLHPTRYMVLIFLVACVPTTPEVPPKTAFHIFRFNPPALIQFSEDYQPIKEIPLSFSPSCGLLNTFPSPRGSFTAIELSCPSGQAVLFLDTDTSDLKPAFSESDSHFLAWTPDGKAAYLKVDSLGNARILRISVTGDQEFIPLPAVTYDLAPIPSGREFTFTFSRGLGYGSEIWFAQRDGRIVEQLIADQFNYISFARWSPDGKQITFIKIPDTQTPFTVGELWAMNANGSRARKLADADAGHGYMANWSPDGKSIAFVLRENPENESANQSSDALISNIYLVEVDSGKLTQLTHFENARELRQSA